MDLYYAVEEATDYGRLASQNSNRRQFISFNISTESPKKMYARFTMTKMNMTMTETTLTT